MGGASVNAVDGEGWSALIMASDCGHVEAVRRLCAAGADVNARAQILKPMERSGALGHKK